MIKGLAITPPTLGRISIGRVVEKNGKRLPEKDDQFTITSQIQSKENGWIKHPLDEQLRANTPNQKLRTIPVRMIFNDPDILVPHQIYVRWLKAATASLMDAYM